jgi:hypothetical protein
VLSGDRPANRRSAFQEMRGSSLLFSGQSAELPRYAIGDIISLLPRRLLDDAILLLGQTVQVAHQPVDLPVGRVDLAMERGTFVCSECTGQVLLAVCRLFGRLCCRCRDRRLDRGVAGGRLQLAEVQCAVRPNRVSISGLWLVTLPEPDDLSRFWFVVHGFSPFSLRNSIVAI